MKLTVAALVAAVLLTGCSQAKTASTPIKTFAIVGTVTVPADLDLSAKTLGGDCVSDPGFPGVHTGNSVRVFDFHDAAIAVGGLDAGHVSELWTDTILIGLPKRCVFAFTVADVPDDLPDGVYSIEVAQEGKNSFRREELDQSVTITVGP